MKITLCGSIIFYDEMLEVKDKLKEMDHEVKLPPSEVKDGDGNSISVKEYYKIRKNEKNEESWIWKRKQEAILEHFKKINWSDAVLILNYEKNNIKDYIGANTLIEMGLAMYLGKKIFLMNKIPDMPYKEEILGTKPIVINGDLGKIK